MAEVPREATEFARLLVRAFYTYDFVVVMDSILRQNNYISHHDLARRLGMQPKELRQILARMETATLMRSERRQQKRINFRDERRPTRTVNTEFWYVPLGELVDAFLYRVHVMSKAIEEKRTNESERQKHVCMACQAEYQLLDILSNMNEKDEFICMRMGVRLDRRQLPCGGIIKQQDNSAEIKETERVKQLLDEELRELRQRAEHCATLDIPLHPLEGADEKTWGERVPETVGVNGEPVDEEGLTAAMKGEAEEKKTDESDRIGFLPSAPDPTAKDDAPIPAKPSWFRESKGDDDMDWETTGHVLENKTGTAAIFEQHEEDNSYYEQYLQNMAGVHTRKPPLPSPGEVIDLDADEEEAKDSTPEVVSAIDENANVIVSVGGENMKMSEVTPAMIEKMTGEEYAKYFELLNQKSTGNEDDIEEELEDDDFE